MQLHEQRVVEEKVELDGKITKLWAFIAGPIFPTITASERDLLKRQHYHMLAYSETLGERIELFSNGGQKPL